MSTLPPMEYVVTEAGLQPLKPRLFFQRAALGEIVSMAPFEERSTNSHNHYFACLHEAYVNLPEDAALRWPTEEIFRKHALILTGHRRETSIACDSEEAAERVAAWTRALDEYAIVSVSGSVVIRWTAKSQSLRAMGREEFQRSKDDVLAWAAEQVGVTVDALTENARKAA